jgi:pimeloyl-ACP methyl ester carboxylesterase
VSGWAPRPAPSRRLRQLISTRTEEQIVASAQRWTSLGSRVGTVAGIAGAGLSARGGGQPERHLAVALCERGGMDTHPSDDTIVLIHGLWMSPLSWEHWVARYAERGHYVLAPAWPGMEDRDVADLRRDTSAFARLGVTEIADHYERLVRELDRPPILIGHSFGGLIVQVLLDRGLGSAGVAIHPAPIKGILGLPWPSLRVASVALRNPLNLHRAVALTADQFHYAFTNTLDRHESALAYERYAVPGPGRPLFQAGLANFNPNAATKVDVRNAARAPLLLIAGGRDHTVPASTTRANYKLYRDSAAITELKEYPERSHFTVGQAGWEEVADHALEWAAERAAALAVPR